MASSRAFTAVLATVALAITIAAPVGAEDTLTAARDLYTAADYENALAVLNRLHPAADDPKELRTIAQYRALCLLALGRNGDAEQAIERIVGAEPSYQPSENDASPRVRGAFRDVRRRMLPALIHDQYGQAKNAFDRKEFVAARDGFRRVMEMLADADLGSAANQSPLADLRTLALGFSDLSAAAAAPPPPPLAPPVPVQPVVAAPPAAPRIYSAADGNVVPPGTIRQTMPAVPFKIGSDINGTLSIVIDEKGVVESASMLVPLNNPYDRLVVEAAKSWRYRPAAIDGAPVKFRKLVQINVAAPR